MAVEIERKFLVTGDTWRMASKQGRMIVDHLIARFELGKARVRFCDGSVTLTFKGQRRGFARSEYHIPLTPEDGHALVEEFAQGAGLEKRRHEVEVGGLIWQVDEYLGVLSGLVTADVELPCEAHDLELPNWAGADITGDPRFGSRYLAVAVEQRGQALSDVLTAAQLE